MLYTEIQLYKSLDVTLQFQESSYTVDFRSEHTQIYIIQFWHLENSFKTDNLIRIIYVSNIYIYFLDLIFAIYLINFNPKKGKIF